jgi:hypothetical protein
LYELLHDTIELKVSYSWFLKNTKHVKQAKLRTDCCPQCQKLHELEKKETGKEGEFKGEGEGDGEGEGEGEGEGKGEGLGNGIEG